jgi:hypothetical protein
MGHENRGKLVALVRQKAKAVAKNEKFDYIISDGAWGIGYPQLRRSKKCHL